MRRPLEANLIFTFRLLVGLEMVVLSMVPLVEYTLLGQFSFVNDPFFSLLYQSIFLFAYLSIPTLQYHLQRWYLPLGIMFAVVTPSFINLNHVLEAITVGQAIEMLHVWAVLPLMMIPLVPMAWQYDFRSVVFLFGSLTVMDMMLVIFNAGGLQFSILNFLYATFIRSVSLFSVGFMISQLMKTQRQQRDQLRSANLKLTRQALVMEEIATIQERNRIARELHDTLAHTLSGLSVQLEAIKTVYSGTDEKVRTMLENALDTTRKGLNETRRVLKALRAAPLAELGLVQAILQLAEDYRKDTQCRIDVAINPDLPVLANPIEQAVYRITQESVKNAIMHANAQNIQVTLQYKSPMLELDIRDDGIGFDIESAMHLNRGFGIRGMRERAELLGGELILKSQPEGGTDIGFRLEVKE